MNNNKALKVPYELTVAPYYHRSLELDGFSAVESCTHVEKATGYMFLHEHMLLYVLKGSNVITHGNVSYVVKENEMLLLNKAIMVKYEKTGDIKSNNTYDSILFFLKDTFLHDFVKQANFTKTFTKEVVKTEVKQVNQRLESFFKSIIPYFSEPEKVQEGLLKIKMTELLYDLAASDNNMLVQLMQMQKPVKIDITQVVEANITNPITLEQLAFLSGRSLSAFKRDFKFIYNTSPAEWIKEKKLIRAKEIIEHTSYPIVDVCYMVGFENPSHFSKAFKQQFGYTPSNSRLHAPMASI